MHPFLVAAAESLITVAETVCYNTKKQNMWHKEVMQDAGNVLDHIEVIQNILLWSMYSCNHLGATVLKIETKRNFYARNRNQSVWD